MSAGASLGPMRATTFERPGAISLISTEKPQSSSTDASARAQPPSPGESGTRVGFLESICIRARASATASPRGTATAYLLFAVLPEALGLDFFADLCECFLAAGFMVGFFAVGFRVAACFAAGFAACLIGAGWWCFTAVECEWEWEASTLGAAVFAAAPAGGVNGFLFACEAS